MAGGDTAGPAIRACTGGVAHDEDVGIADFQSHDSVYERDSWGDSGFGDDGPFGVSGCFVYSEDVHQAVTVSQDATRPAPSRV